MGIRVQGGQFERIAKRDQVPLETIWEPQDKLRGEVNKWHKQTFNVNSITDYAVAKIKRENGEVSETEWDLYTNPAELIEENRGLIEEHLDRRIQLFFMQLICCYRTPYHFEWIEANDEYGKGSKVKIKNPKGVGSHALETEAAHSSTFPCLIAYPKEEWEEGNKSNGFVYLKYAHSYLQHNGTVEFARYMNRADCLIDGTHTDSKLRNEAIKIVNAVAEGTYGPEKGIRKFTELLEGFIVRTQEILQQKTKTDDPRYLILHRYLERAHEVSAEMQDDSGYFDQLLGVKVDEHPREEILRNVVYRKRFKLIQNCEDIESKIARDILTSQNAMLNKHNKGLKSVDARLRYILLEDANPNFKRTLERLFCTSLEQLQTDIEKNENRLREFEGRARIASFREEHKGAISVLKRDLRARFRALDNFELNYRSGLFKGLRVNLNNWYQKEFVTEFRKKHKFESMSQAMVSRLEQRTRAIGDEREYKSPLAQRRKDIDESKARKIANTFGVDAGLFLPAIVSSVY